MAGKNLNEVIYWLALGFSKKQSQQSDRGRVLIKGMRKESGECLKQAMQEM